MPPTPSRSSYITLDELQPCVDFAASCDQVGPIQHRYRIPGQHFILVERGSIVARTPTAQVVAQAGDLLCFPPTEANRYGFDGPARFWEAHIHFAPPPNHGRQLWLDGLGALPLRVVLGDALARTRQVFETICTALPHPGAMSRARTSAAAWELIAIISERLLGVGLSDTARLDRWQRLRLRLSGDLREKLSLRVLAAEERLTVETLIRGFQRRFDLTPAQYRGHCRLRHAASRLRCEDVAIKTLAAELGFGDSYAFSRAFRRHFGMLPSQLRQGGAVALPADPLATGLRLNVPLVPPVAPFDFMAEVSVR